jgi:hypothetical protein
VDLNNFGNFDSNRSRVERTGEWVTQIEPESIECAVDRLPISKQITFIFGLNAGPCFTRLITSWSRGRLRPHHRLKESSARARTGGTFSASEGQSVSEKDRHGLRDRPPAPLLAATAINLLPCWQGHAAPDMMDRLVAIRTAAGEFAGSSILGGAILMIGTGKPGGDRNRSLRSSTRAAAVNRRAGGIA